MNVEKSFFNRRALFRGSAAVGIVAALELSGRGALPEITTSVAHPADLASLPAGDPHLEITLSSDPGFEAKLKTLFPTLVGNTSFAAFQPLAYIVTNVAKSPVYAYSADWTIITSQGAHKTTLGTFFRPRLAARQPGTASPKTKHGRVSGGTPLLRAGASRLVTPFFSWTPKFVARSKSVDWDKLASRTARTGFYAYLAQDVQSITVLVHSSVRSLRSAAADTPYSTNNRLRAQRNAQHDAAISVSLLIKGGASESDLLSKLVKQAQGFTADKNGKPIDRSEPAKYLYYEARSRQAAVLALYLSRHKQAKLEKLVKYLIRRPKMQSDVSTKG